MKPYPRIMSAMLAVLQLCASLSGCAPVARQAAPAETDAPAITAAPAFDVEEQLLLAEKAFSGGNYEETILILNTVIEVEPANPRGYLRLADVYIERGEKDRAMELLQTGYEKTGDQEIRDRLLALTQPLPKAKDVEMGWTCSLIVGQDGQLYFSGVLCGDELPTEYVYYTYGNDWPDDIDVLYRATYPIKIEGIENVKQAYVDVLGNGIAALTETGELYLWNTEYLPDGKSIPAKAPVKVLDHVAAAKFYSVYAFILKDNGELYSWGINMYGALGRNLPITDYSPDAKYYAVGKVMDHVRQIIDSAQAVITESNDLYMWGSIATNLNGVMNSESYNRPKKIMSNVQSIRECEDNYLVTDTSGIKGMYQLAFGENAPEKALQLVPVDYDYTRPYPRFVRAKSGGYYPSISTIFLDEDGNLWGKGENTSGLFGKSVSELKRTSLPEKNLDGQNIVDFGLSGSGSIIALTASGKILAWGNNDYGQLGNGRSGMQHNRQGEWNCVLADVKDVTSVGSEFYALTEKGELYMWGSIVRQDFTVTLATPTRLMDHVRAIKATYSPQGYLSLFAITEQNGLYERSIGSALIAHNSAEDQYQAYPSLVQIKEDVWDAAGVSDNFLVINADRSLSISGNNEYGQLDLPEEMSSLRFENVYGFYSDYYSTDYVLSTGKILSETHKAELELGALTTGGEFYRFHYDGKIHDGKGSWTKTASDIREIRNLFFLQDYVLLTRDGRARNTQGKLIKNISDDGQFALDEQGNVVFKKEFFQWFDIADNPILEGIKDFDTAYSAYAIIAANGELYTTGDNTYGQLGVGDSAQDESIFEITIPG